LKRIVKRKKLSYKEENKKREKKIQQKEFGSPLPNISKFWHSSLTK
jgi:hypothetical protein